MPLVDVSGIEPKCLGLLRPWIGHLTLLKAIQPLLREKLLDDIQKYEENKYVLDDKGKKKKNIKPKYYHIRITNYDISVH